VRISFRCLTSGTVFDLWDKEKVLISSIDLSSSSLIKPFKNLKCYLLHHEKIPEHFALHFWRNFSFRRFAPKYGSIGCFSLSKIGFNG